MFDRQVYHSRNGLLEVCRDYIANAARRSAADSPLSNEELAMLIKWIDDLRAPPPRRLKYRPWGKARHEPGDLVSARQTETTPTETLREPRLSYFIDFFGWPMTPCGDCVYNQCTMNCSTPMKPNPHQCHGAIIVHRTVKFGPGGVKGQPRSTGPKRRRRPSTSSL